MSLFVSVNDESVEKDNDLCFYDRTAGDSQKVIIRIYILLKKQATSELFLFDICTL